MSEANFSRKGKSFNRQQSAKIPTSISQNASKPNPRWLLVGFGLSAIAVFSATVGALLALSLSHTPLRQAKLTPAQEAVFNQEETLTFDSLQIPKLSRPVNILVLGIKVTSDDVPDQESPGFGVSLPS